MNHTETEFALMFVIATIGMLLLSIAIILFVVFYQKRMLEEQLKRQSLEAGFQRRMLEVTLDSQENERKRVSADLHDSVGAMLSTIRLGLLSLVRKDGISEESILPTKQLLDETIDSLRTISRDLMPVTLQRFGLSQTVKEMCDRVSSTGGLVVIYEESEGSVRLSEKKEVMIFRIVQELLNNAIKHSGASEIFIQFIWGQDLSISVCDNGIGFDYQKVREGNDTVRGLGLYTIENRVRLFHGTIKFEETKKGTTILIRLPINENIL